jgi:hypothetical protein
VSDTYLESARLPIELLVLAGAGLILDGWQLAVVAYSGNLA